MELFAYKPLNFSNYFVISVVAVHKLCAAFYYL